MDHHPFNLPTRKPNTAAESKRPKLLPEKLPNVQISKPRNEFADCKGVEKLRAVATVDF